MPCVSRENDGGFKMVAESELHRRASAGGERAKLRCLWALMGVKFTRKLPSYLGFMHHD